jgi:hypothetical protein
MTFQKSLATVFAVLLLASHADAASLKKVALSRGYLEGCIVSRPVFDTAGVGPIEITVFREAYDKNQNVIRPKGKAIGGKIKIDKKLDLGAVFAEALRTEAPKLGFATGSGGWKIGGEIQEIYVDWWRAGGGFGAVLMYTSMTVKFEVQSPTGERHESTQRLLGYFVGGLRADTALARQIVFAAQDALARLNASTFKAPAHTGVATMLEELRGAQVADAKDLIRMIGLSGSREAVGPLVDKLRAEKDEGDRNFVVEALAVVGNTDVLEPLSIRYAGEDIDNRLATLKAYEYAGSASARRLAGDAGAKEPDDYLKKLAREIADGASLRGTAKR